MVERDATGPIQFKVNKVTNKRVPDYLKEDFPSKSLHAARFYCRKMNEGVSVSPTANQYNQILDNFTMTKGVPSNAIGPIGIKPKQKWTDKNIPLSFRDSTGSTVINTIDSARLKEEQDEYDMQYKTYFGHEGLEIRPQMESHSHHSLTLKKTLNDTIIKLHQASAEKPPLAA